MKKISYIVTKEDREHLIDALHKCIDVNGDSETHYNTLANVIEAVKNCSISNAEGQSGQLFNFLEYWKKKMGGSFMTQILETSIKQYLEGK